MTKNTQATLPERPHWDPEQNFPIDYANASLESRIGALLALIEHQQVRTLKTLDASVVDRNMKSVMAFPRIHLPRIMQLAHHHEARGRHAGAGRRHGRMIDALLRHIPPSKDLPTHVPRTHRWDTVHTYRLVRAHLEDTFSAFWSDYQEWKDLREARKEPYEADPDAIAFETDPDEDKKAS